MHVEAIVLSCELKAGTSKKSGNAYSFYTGYIRLDNGSVFPYSSSRELVPDLETYQKLVISFDKVKVT